MRQLGSPPIMSAGGGPITGHLPCVQLFKEKLWQVIW